MPAAPRTRMVNSTSAWCVIAHSERLKRFRPAAPFACCRDRSNLVLRSALARVSKDGHKRDRAGGHPSRRSARKAARRAPQDEAFESDWFHGIDPLVAAIGIKAARPL